MSLVLTVCRLDVDNYEDGRTIGAYYIGGGHAGYTLENPWLDNKKSVSCIPTGEYKTDVRKASESGSRDYDHLILRDVPNRTYILWHIGNYARNTEGCILPGKSAHDNMVGNSKPAFRELMVKCKKADEIVTRITNVSFGG